MEVECWKRKDTRCTSNIQHPMEEEKEEQYIGF